MMGLQDNEAVVNSQEVPMRNGAYDVLVKNHGNVINGCVSQGGPVAGMHEMIDNIGVLGV